MAIYYGCDSWKAYYRRGYALAHLKMWEKAILGPFFISNQCFSLR